MTENLITGSWLRADVLWPNVDAQHDLSSGFPPSSTNAMLEYFDDTLDTVAHMNRRRKESPILAVFAAVIGICGIFASRALRFTQVSPFPYYCARFLTRCLGADFDMTLRVASLERLFELSKTV
jgi:hypothetical protein